ncbi:unnamed protein product, partial [Prorocentrum cordatum]
MFMCTRLPARCWATASRPLQVRPSVARRLRLRSLAQRSAMRERWRSESCWQYIRSSRRSEPRSPTEAISAVSPYPGGVAHLLRCRTRGWGGSLTPGARSVLNFGQVEQISRKTCGGMADLHARNLVSDRTEPSLAQPNSRCSSDPPNISSIPGCSLRHPR